jgi:hypothetical protein
MLRLTAILWVVLAACIAGPTATDVATTTTVPTTTTIVVLSIEEAIAEFQVCLSGHGIEAVVPLGDDGRPDLTALGLALGQNLPELREALADCAVLLASSGALDLNGEPVLREAVRTQLTNFSTCMRSQGVEEFPDPEAQFDGTAVPYPVIDLPINDPEFGSAIDACAAAVGVDPLRR